MKTLFSSTDDFDKIYKIITGNCEKFKTESEQINYLTRVINECSSLSYYKHSYENDLIELDDMVKIMPGLIIHFYDVKENKELSKVSELKLLYITPGDIDYNSILKNSVKLMEQLKVDCKVITGLAKKVMLKDSIIEAEKIKINTSLSDVVRIFESMIEASIISINTKVRQIVQMFFTENEKEKETSLETNYNSTYSRIRKEKSTTTSKALVNFVKILIEKSFYNKESILEEILQHIEKLQKNVISVI